MVHGGLRYIAKGQLGLTRDSVRERQRLLGEAPGLVDVLPFLFPHYRGKFPGPRGFGGLLGVYDALAGQRLHRYHPAGELRYLAPGLNDTELLGGTLFTDAVTDDARMVMRVLGEALRARLPGLQVLVQGEGTRHSLMERFRQGSAQGAPGCVLVASVSFWEGVDVPGDALQLVVIDKLPFPVPSDPLVQAHAQRLRRAGRSPFRDHALPEAAVALKQGAGRLIRHETDEGILVVADTRLLDRGYGKRLMAALPTMRRLGSAEEFDDALKALITRTSTMDRSCP